MKQRVWFRISLVIILMVGFTIFPATMVAQQNGPRRPNVHFDIDAYDLSMAGCSFTGEGAVVLRATSARLNRNQTQLNARTDVEVQLSTQETETTVEFIAEGSAVIILNMGGKLPLFLPTPPPVTITSTPLVVGRGTTETLTFDCPIQVTDVEHYLVGMRPGDVTVSLCVVHDIDLSLRVACPGEAPVTLDVGKISWTRNYLVTGFCDLTGHLGNTRVIPDPDIPEIGDAMMYH